MHNVVKFIISSSATGLEFKREISTSLEDFNSDDAALNVYTSVIQDTVEVVGAELKPLLAMMQFRAEHTANTAVENIFVVTLTETDDTVQYDLTINKDSDTVTPAAFIVTLVKHIYKFVGKTMLEEDDEIFAAFATAVGTKNMQDILQILGYDEHTIAATVRLNDEVSAHVAKTKGTTTPSFMMESTGTLNA